jgi:DNA-binding transcriptional LysR family regulator
MRICHTMVGMDLVAACRVFVSVAERASFTDGAALSGVTQSVASRRVASLEAHVGRRLFDRTTRSAVLTPLGHDLIEPARRLVEFADAFEHDAERARQRPLTLTLPAMCSTLDLARLDAAARSTGHLALELLPADPRRRLELVAARRARVGVVAVPRDAAHWIVPLGVAGTAVPDPGFRLESLRPSRVSAHRRRIWLQPEDDVPHVRDVLRRAGERTAIAPAQLPLARTLAAAAAAALSSDDLLLCSQAQAAALGLQWTTMHDPDLARGYALRASREDAALLAELTDELGRSLGVPPHPAGA